MYTNAYDEYVKSQFKCKCGVKLVNYTMTNEINNRELFYKLKACVNCGKNYLIKDGEPKLLSRLEFRKILYACKEIQK